MKTVRNAIDQLLCDMRALSLAAMKMKTVRNAIDQLLSTGGYRGRPLAGLGNDARYWDLVRTYGEYSREVLHHLRACSAVQARDENHT
jgi:hypothetical protein